MIRTAGLLAVAMLVVLAPALGGMGGGVGAGVVAAGGDDDTTTEDDTTTDDDTTTTTTTTTTEDQTYEGAPNIRVFAPDNRVEPGAETRLGLKLSNTGEVEGGLDTPPEVERLLTTARDVRVTVEAGDAPIEVRTSTTPLPDIPAGSIAEAGFEVAVDQDADPGVYDVPVTVRYEYTSSISGDDRDVDTETAEFDVRLVVAEDARFEVVDVDGDLQVGESGTVAVTLENVGEADLTDTAVTISSLNGDLQLAGGTDATRFVGDWDAGDERTVEVEATALEGSGPHRYALSATVQFTDPDGDPGESLPLFFGVRLDDEQAFTVDDVDGDLRVGRDGTVTGTVTNEGPEPVGDAVVRLVDGDGDVVAQRNADVVGDLDAGESESFSFPVRVLDTAKPGDRRLEFVVAYVNTDGDPRTSDPQFDTVGVAGERDRFTVQDVDERLLSGETSTVDVAIRNAGDEDLTDATVLVRSPNADLQVGGGREATRYVGDWDAGDRETITVEVTPSNRFAGGDYPLELVVSYTDSDGDERQSTVLVRVRPADGQDFAVRDVASTLRIDAEGRLNGSIVNLGPRAVDTAVVRLASEDAKLRPRESTAVLGDLDSDERARFSLPITVARTAQPGPRRVTLVVEYVTREGNRRESDPLSVIVDVSSRTDRFELRRVQSDLQADDTGTVVLTLHNRLNETLRDASVALVAESPGLVLVGDGTNESRFVGDWPGNTTRSIRYRVRADPDTGRQTFALRATVAYEDDQRQRQRSAPLYFGSTPVAEQAFAVRTEASTLRVGEEGRVRTRVTNLAGRPVSAVGVELVTDTPNVNAIETTAAVGDVAAGGSATFSLPIEIGESADPGPRQLSYRVVYTDDDGDRRTSDVLVAEVRVAPRRDPFRVESRDVSVTAGESDVLALVVTNTRGVTVRNVRVKAFADDPLDVDESEVFVQSLAPNESTVVRFDVSVAGGASPRTYPIAVDFLYTIPDGDDELSDPVNVGVSVTEPPDQSYPDWLPLLGALVLLAVLVVWVVRRRGGRTGRDGNPPEQTTPPDGPAEPPADSTAATERPDGGIQGFDPVADSPSAADLEEWQWNDPATPDLEEWVFGATDGGDDNVGSAGSDRDDRC